MAQTAQTGCVEKSGDASPVVVATHNGPFHADECVAVAILRGVFPEMKLIRTRNPEVLATASIAVDIGYGEFDHHQPGGNGKRSNGLPFASAGLVWRKFGEEFLLSAGCAPSDVPAWHAKIDEEFITPVDAADNGVLMEYVAPYSGFNRVIAALNPTWEDPREAETRQFEMAVSIAETVLRSYAATIRAAGLVKEALQTNLQDGGVLVLHRYAPWQEHIDERVNFVVFPAPQAGQYNVQAAPTSPGSFQVKNGGFPPGWRGLSAQKLDEAIGDGKGGSVFCHPAGFIAGAKSMERAVEMAQISMGVVKGAKS